MCVCVIVNEIWNLKGFYSLKVICIYLFVDCFFVKMAILDYMSTVMLHTHCTILGLIFTFSGDCGQKPKIRVGPSSQLLPTSNDVWVWGRKTCLFNQHGRIIWGNLFMISIHVICISEITPTNVLCFKAFHYFYTVSWRFPTEVTTYFLIDAIHNLSWTENVKSWIQCIWKWGCEGYIYTLYYSFHFIKILEYL